MFSIAWLTGKPNLQARWFGVATRQLQRLTRVVPGRIFGLYGEAVAGSAVIRAFGVQSIYLQGELPKPHD
jgi:hypothetical protein